MSKRQLQIGLAAHLLRPEHVFSINFRHVVMAFIGIVDEKLCAVFGILFLWKHCTLFCNDRLIVIILCYLKLAISILGKKSILTLQLIDTHVIDLFSQIGKKLECAIAAVL